MRIIPKYQTGNRFKWQRDLNLDYDDILEKAQYNTRNFGFSPYNPNYYKYRAQYDSSLGFRNPVDYGDPWESRSWGNNQDRYQSLNFTREEVNRIQNKQDYIDQTNALFNSDGTLSKIGLDWARDYDNRLPDNHPAKILKSDGITPVGYWKTTSKDKFGVGGVREYNNIKDYITHLRTDDIAGAAHDNYIKSVDRYFYWDDPIEKRNKIWVNPDEIDFDKYDILKNQEEGKSPFIS